MPMSLTPELEGLITYLNACGGHDRFESFDTMGEPDPIAARDVAERLRATLGNNLDVVASVHQSGSRVTITLLVEPAPV